MKPLLAALVVLAALAGAPGAAGLELSHDALASGRASAVAPLAEAPCSDAAYNLLGGRWTRTMRWAFHASSTPAGLSRADVRAVLRRSFSNITDARNDCGRPDRVDATHEFLGNTRRRPSITAGANCAPADGRNIVGFGELPAGILAVTCTRFFGNFIVEADIRINSRYSWATSVGSCSDEELIEPTVTHEVGHAFGLGHVGERRHGLLTMSTRSDGSCDDGASTLGLGDMRGLEKLY